MKKLILALMLTAFAAVTYASDAKATKETKEAGSCCAAKATQAKTASADTAKAKSADSCCGGCCKETVKLHALLSPKAAAERGM